WMARGDKQVASPHAIGYDGGVAVRAGPGCFLFCLRESSEPHVVRCFQYKPCMVHLRQRLAKFIREKRGKTPQRDFARKIGEAQSTIMRIENEDQNVTLSTLETLCQVFHTDIGDLFPRVDKVKVYPSHPLPGLNVPEARSAVTLHDEPATHETSTPSRPRRKK